MWGIVEALQVMENFGLFDTKVPCNASTFIDEMGSLTDLSPIDIDTAEFLSLPERDAFSLQFYSAGNESVYMIVLLGTPFYQIILILALFLADCLMKPFAHKYKCIGRIR